MITIVYFWKVSATSVPLAVMKMALNRFTLRRNSKITFYKLLGCGKGRNFMPSDADPFRWGMIVCIEEDALEEFDKSAVITSWRKWSIGEFRAILNPISSHGKWSGKNPFDFTSSPNSANLGVVAITRAKIAWRHYPRFLRAIPPVNADLQVTAGRIASFGIGEAPIGLQGTFSHWESATALRDFAYKGQAHALAISATEKFQWYSEELFARFDVQEIRGEL